MFEFLRKFLLLMLLFVVALGTYLSAANSTDWKETLWIQVYPINGDGRDKTTRYIEALDAKNFGSIESFMEREASRYGVAIDKPVKMILGSPIETRPPEPPVGGNFLKIAAWSLQLRWWTWQATNDHVGPRPDIRLFLVYFDPEETPVLRHSVGLQKGRVGIVNAFSDRKQSSANHFVIAHEMLHTLGASDKYGGPLLMPVYPEGYGDPNRTPLYPQKHAEVMGGRIALSETEAMIPRGLRQVRVGPTTAAEIRWLR